MADKYFDPTNGDNADTGGVGDPYETYATAESNTSNGETIAAIDGTHRLGATDGMAIADGRIVEAQTYKQVTIQAALSDSVRVCRVRNVLTSADTVILKGIVFDAEGRVTNPVQFQTVAPNAPTIRVHGCEFKDAAGYHILAQYTDGRFELHDCKISGLINSGIAFGSSASNTGNHYIEINDMEFDVTMDTGSLDLIQVSKVSAGANILDVFVKALRGRITFTEAGMTPYLLDITGAEAPVIANCDLVVDEGGLTNTDGYGLLIRGRDASTTTDDCQIVGNKLVWPVSAGYGIAFGIPLNNSFMGAGGIVAGNVVTGKYYASATPHNIAMGEDTNGDCYGNVSRDGAVGILLSRCTDVNCKGNLLVDCYGPSIYVKGTDAATIENNICVVSSKYVQREQGILGVSPQSGQDTGGADFRDNVVIVQDPSNIHALAQINNSSQVCTFTSNTYILPDTVNLASDVLFGYQTTTPADTFSAWLARAEVTDDEVILLPQSEIDAMVGRYKAQADAAAGSGGGGNSSMGIAI